MEDDYDAYEGTLDPASFFRINKQEEIIASTVCEIGWEYSKSFGNAYICTSFLCFHSDDFKTRFTFPLAAVRKLERENSDNDTFTFDLSNFHSQIIHLRFKGTRQQSEFFCDRLVRQLHASLEDASSVGLFLLSLASERVCFSESANSQEIESIDLGLGSQFGYPIASSNTNGLINENNSKSWIQYLKKNGANFNLIQTPNFQKLVQSGIPNNLRADIWETCSGSLFPRWKSKGFYAKNIDSVINNRCEYSEEIEKDLTRSLPDYPAYQSPTGINTLRRILLFYSETNKEVGYCQAMNIVLAALLVYCTEEQAYFLFSQLCEFYIPGYYAKIIHGLLLDLTVFEYVLEHTLPHLYQKIIELDMDLKLITINWFFSLFIKDFRLDYAFRILDCLFVNGPRVLFQVALALFKVNAQGILNATDDSSVMKVFRQCFDHINQGTAADEKMAALGSRSSMCTLPQLFAVAFEYFDFITDSFVSAKRKEFKSSVLYSLRCFTKRSHLRSVYQTTLLSNTDLDLVYDAFINAIGENNICHGDVLEQKIDFNGFERLVDCAAPPLSVIREPLHYQRSKRKLFTRLYIWMKDGDSTETSLTFKRIIHGLERLKADIALHSETLCFQLYDLKRDGTLRTEEVVELSESLILLCCYEGDEKDEERLTVISEFLKSCFSGCQDRRSFQITMEDFQAIVDTTGLHATLEFFLKKLIDGLLGKLNAS